MATPLAWEEASWSAELTRRAPSLLVLEFGTNESGDINVKPRAYADHLAKVMARARRALPDVDCVVVAPTDRADTAERTPLVRDALQQAALFHQLAGRAIHLGGPFERLVEIAGLRRDDHEILDIDAPPGMRAAAKDLDLGQWHNRLGLLAEQIRIKRPAYRVGGSMQCRHRHRDKRIAAEPFFLGRAVERDQHAVDRALVGRVQTQ